MSGIKNLLILALAGASLLPALASAANAPAATFTAEQEARIGKIAADYLVAHPEVLLQASQKLQQIQAEQQASAATQAVIKNADKLTQDKATPTARLTVKSPLSSSSIINASTVAASRRLWSR